MINDIKTQLRLEILSRRRSLDVEAKNFNSNCMKNHLRAWNIYQNAKSIMIYLSMYDEPQTDAIILDALQSGKKVCVPRMLSVYGQMEAVELRNFDHLVAGRLGIREPRPTDTAVLNPQNIDLILVPGVVFDTSGNRIGMGAGYYDRFLAQASQATLLGIAWQFQVESNITSEKHDVKMHYLLTETGILHCTKGKM